jgi:hypothetical protein
LPAKEKETLIPSEMNFPQHEPVNFAKPVRMSVKVPTTRRAIPEVVEPEDGGDLSAMNV